MVNLHDSVVTPQTGLAFVKLWHVLAGIYFWEFFTTLDYEWKVIRGHLPHRWTIWIYFFARVACLVGILLSIVGMDFTTTTGTHCQLWISLIATIFCLSLAAASLLIVLRIIAIWNGNKAVMATVITLWLIGVGFHILGCVQYRSVWDPSGQVCLYLTTKAGALAFTPTIFVDVALLLFMLVGLVLLRRSNSGSFGLTLLILKQGVVWVLLALFAEVPQTVVAVMSSNGQFIEMLLTPGLITMIIASTRMHRFLIDFASGSPDVTIGDLQAGSVTLSKSKPGQTAPSLPNRIEVNVHMAFEQHSAPRMNEHESCESANEQMHEKPNVRRLGDDIESGM